MGKVKNIFARFLSNESGATAIEYGLLITILGTGLIAGSGGFAQVIVDLWESIADRM